MPLIPTPESLGFTLPTDTDLVRYGDDAITNNAKKSVAAIQNFLAGHRINPGESLNDILTPGFYYLLTGADAPTDGSYPAKDAGGLHVIAYQGSSYRSVFQIWYAYLKGEVYTRRIYRDTWTPWKRSASSDEVTASITSNLSTTKAQLTAEYNAKINELKPQIFTAINDASDATVDEVLDLIRDEAAQSLAQAKAYTDDAFAASGPGGASDAQVDAAINRAVSQQRVLAPSDAIKPGDLYVSVKDHGAKGNGITDDTAAINAAHSAAKKISPDAVLFFPAGTYLAGPLEITTGLEARGATIRSTATDAPALTLGSASTVTSRRSYYLPRLIHKPSVDAGAWRNEAVGARLVNLNGCNVIFDFIQAFTEGFVCEGAGQGFAYNIITLGTTWNCRRHIALRPSAYLGANGWVNQNLYLNGRIGAGWGTADDPDAYAIGLEPGSGPLGGPNNNTFIGTSIEGSNRHLYRLIINGSDNRFTNLRWETPRTEEVRIYYGPQGHYNLVDGGYNLGWVKEVFDPAAFKNRLRIDNYDIEFHGYQAEATVIPTATKMPVRWLQTNGWHCTYDKDTQTFKPRQGRWDITATVALSATAAAGHADVIVETTEGTVLSVVRVPITRAGSFTATTNVKHDFRGSEGFRVFVNHTNGADVTVISSQRYCMMQAEMVG